MRLELALQTLRDRASLLVAMLLAVSMAAGCSGLVEKPAASSPETKAQAQAEEEVPPEPQVVYPNVELTPQILYDVVLGEVAAQRGDYEAALGLLMPIAEQTRDPRLIERAAQVAVLAKRYDEALKASRLWVEVVPDSVAAREILGTILLAMGKTEEAAPHFEKVIGLYGAHPSLGYRRLGEILGRSQQGEAAVELMLRLVDMHPQLAEAQLRLAQVAARQRDVEQAQVAIDRALALRPDWEDAAIFKAQLLSLRNQLAELDRFCGDFFREHGDSLKLRVAYARILLDHERMADAREQFKRVVEIDPDNAEATFAAGLLAVEARDFEDADAYLRRALELNPGNDQARVYLGQVAMERGKYDQAIAWFRSVPEGTYYFEAQVRVAMATAKEGKIDEALAQLSGISVASDQQRVQIALTEEQILREAGRLQQAMDAVSRAINELPDNKDLLYTRALLAAQLSLLDIHEQDLRKVLDQDPSNAHALNALGYTLADKTDRLSEALGLIKQALELRPDDPFILDSMGWVQYRLGNLAKAVEYLEKAMTRRPDPEIAAHLGEVLWKMGKHADARAAWDRGLDLAPDNDVLRQTIDRFGK